jgi:hypothetical protein
VVVLLVILANGVTITSIAAAVTLEVIEGVRGSTIPMGLFSL